ncbi:hypothetical protein ACOTWI_10980, partial [Aliarcobacter butzleri]
YTLIDIKTKYRFNGFLTVWSGINKDGSGLDYSRMYGPQDIDEDNVDVYASVPFNLGSREHEIIAVFQYKKQNSKETWKGDGDF